MPVSQQYRQPVDSRRHTRRACAAEVEIRFEGEGARPLAATIRDISMGGMFVCTSRAVAPDTTFTASLYPPTNPPFKVRGRVIFLREGEGFGCIFVRVPQTATMLLVRWLGRCGGLPPVAGTIEPRPLPRG
jgi:hypothetical protein